MAPAESCHNCVYSHWDRNLALWTMTVGVRVRPTCANQPDYPGRMRECPLGTVCRNYRPKPPTPTGPTVKTIPLGEGFLTYVDAADFEWLNQWTWHLHSGYAARAERRKEILMHRQIMQPPEGMVVDHRNRNKLDNTRANLWICTPQENACNRAHRRSAFSRFHGVSYAKERGKYRAYLYHKGERFYGGYFTDELEAARARDYKAVQVLGAEARLNLPGEWPPERVKRVHAQWLRAQARLKAKEPRPRSKKSKHKNRKSQIVNRKSKAPRAKAPKGPARKKKATGRRKRTKKGE
jgi:hypothetical protein